MIILLPKDADDNVGRGPISTVLLLFGLRGGLGSARLLLGLLGSVGSPDSERT